MSIYAWIILIYLHFYFWINTLNTVFFILFLSVTPLPLFRIYALKLIDMN